MRGASPLRPFPGKAMRALHIKLWRDIIRLWPQALAIAMVMAAGVATLILGAGAHDSLATTRARYYEATALPMSLPRRPGSPRPSPPRSRRSAAWPRSTPASRRSRWLTSRTWPSRPPWHSCRCPAIANRPLNRLVMRSGQAPDPEADDEAIASEGFARAHGLAAGSTIRVLINGRLRAVRITGTALSPEYIYALGPGDLMPDDRRFGVLWMPQRALAAAYDLDGAFNSVAVKLTPGDTARRSDRSHRHAAGGLRRPGCLFAQGPDLACLPGRRAAAAEVDEPASCRRSSFWWQPFSST